MTDLVIDEGLLLASLNEDPDWRNLGQMWLGRAKIECPRAKENGGGLAASLNVRFNAGALPNIECGSDLTRAKGVSALGLIHDGTDEHEIEGKNSPRKLLRFRNRAGTIVFRRRVNHPGTHPNLFMERSMQQAIVMAGGSASTG